MGGAAADDGSSGAEVLMDTANAVFVELVEWGLLDADDDARMSHATRDVEHFADRVAGFFEAAFGPSLFSALSPGSRSSQAVAELMTEFRTRLAARVAADPGAVETRWHVALLRIVRR
ncbi:hypothetical protein [Streptomyces massasporeus]|uniref:hypothetical protein n=1 Tax=Streptomyces massasporeus TaxID=67324 RepID=UPI00167A0A78|nr:hypothetical protein [Streptomyces massasporeus]GGV87495.1 hypothetical protein GCM10010228_69830 [Streptomyces massasporeus]